MKITNEEAITDLKKLKCFQNDSYAPAINKAIKALSVQPKKGEWKRISPAGIYECSWCGQNVMTGDIKCYKFCHGCGAKMKESK